MGYDMSESKQLITSLTNLLTLEKEKYTSGEIAWNVGNQFNETIIESAIENINEDTLAKYLKNFKNSVVTPMTIAHYFSTFDIEEPSRAWFD